MPKEYSAFLPSIKDLEVGEGVKLMIRDLTPGPRKYDARYVEAIIANSLEKLPEADTLIVRSGTGYTYPQRYAIKITKELGQFPPEGGWPSFFLPPKGCPNFQEEPRYS